MLKIENIHKKKIITNNMIIEKNKNSLIKTINKIRKKINFVPTMGNLHEGHLNLIQSAIKQNHFSLVSIFVNKLQFNSEQDFKKYPRTINNDLKLLQKIGVDLVFLPNDDFISKKSFEFEFDNLNNKLCGIDRPGHFEGVVTVMYNFLDLIRPDFLTLGEKDFQQILVVKKLIKDHSFRTKVIINETTRDINGLALSSRNQLLSSLQKKKSSYIFKILIEIERRLLEGCFKKTDLQFFKKKILKIGFDRIVYLQILKEKNLEDIDALPSKSRVFISVVVKDEVRLIDNISVPGNLAMIEGKFVVV